MTDGTYMYNNDKHLQVRNISCELLSKQRNLLSMIMISVLEDK